MNTRILILSIIFLLVQSASARVRAQCDCRHAKSQQSFPLTVDFVSGGELNQLTNQSRFHPTGAYGVVWLGEGKNTVVEFNGMFFSNPVKPSEVTKKTFQGTDLGGVGWTLLPREFSDAMLEGKALQSYSGQGGGQAAAAQPRELTDTYPNGQAIEEVRNYYYPNGQLMTDVAGFRYANGKPRSIQGRDYYPNGQQVSSQGQFFYPTGKRLTQSAPAGSGGDIQYLNDKGEKISRAPQYVTVVDDKWTYYFPVYNGQVSTDQFQVDLRSPEGLISIQIQGSIVVKASVR